MRDTILKIFADYNTVLAPDGWNFLSGVDNPKSVVENILCDCDKDELPFPVDARWLESYIHQQKEAIQDNAMDVAKMTPASIMIKVMHDITGNSTCTGELQDFVTHFNSRYNKMRSILMGRRESRGCMDIMRAKKRPGKAKIIAMVGDVTETKKGYKILRLEDGSGQIKGMISPGSPAHEKYVLEDEVVIAMGEVAPKSKDYSETFFIDDIVRPSIPRMHDDRDNGKNVEGKIAFIGDLHVGSTSFMKASWDKFIAWINSEEKDAKDISYLIIPGDIIDGIGIYPNQREDLEISDVFEQYKEAARMLREIPDKVKIIIIPGNHDIVRNPEPQPAFPEEIKSLFSENVMFFGNPAFLDINGLKILLYHGSSITDLADIHSDVKTKKPTTAMIEMLERRHLVPVYGMKTPIAPEEEDHLIIEEVPDIFVTGHIHRCDVDEYHGVMMINSSTWQDQTDYQRMRDIIPEPAKVVLLDSASKKVSIRSFE